VHFPLANAGQWPYLQINSNGALPHQIRENIMKRYIVIHNWKTGEEASRMDVTGKSENHIERAEMGALMRVDFEAGWTVDVVTEEA
jgi:hypothetical protein